MIVMQFEKIMKLKHNKDMKNKVILVVIIILSSLLVPLSISDRTNATTLNSNVGDIKIANCPMEGLGWIFCRLLDIGTAATDRSYSVLQGMLKIEPQLLTGKSSSEGQSNTRQLWEAFRNIANVIMIIIILLVVASYVTGFGLNDYQIKKMAPKIIVAVVLINLSFIITLLAVDISNIVGNSIIETFDSITKIQTIQQDGLEFAAGAAGGVIFAAVSALIVNRFAPIVTFIIPIIFTVLMIVLTALVLMLLRQAAIIMIAVLSPIAFAAMLLPGTKKAFDVWKSALQTIVLTYPIIALMFGAGRLAGDIIVTAGGGGNSDPLLLFLGNLLPILPLVLVPSTIRNSVAKIPLVGQAANKYLGKLQSWGSSFAKNNKFNQLASGRWQQKRRTEALKAGREGARFGDVLKHPTAWIASKNKYGRAHLNELELQQEKDVQAMARQLDQNDIDSIWNSKSFMNDSDKKKQLSKHAQDVLAANGGDFGKMYLAANEALSKKPDSNPEMAKDLNNAALGYSSISPQQVRRSNQRSEANSRAANNIAMTAAYNHANRTNSAKLDTSSGVYASYLRNDATPSEIANASPESLNMVGGQIKYLYNNDSDFKSNTDNIIGGGFNASAGARSTLSDIIR